MGLGFNLGNTFDLNLRTTDPAKIRPMIDLYVAAGMKHIRIPVSWTEEFAGDNLADHLGNIDAEHQRLQRLREVVDYALSKGLYVVLNTHHERAFKETYNGSEFYDAIFTNLWTRIATLFADAPPELIFEVLNEPEGAFGDNIGGRDPGSEEAIAWTRRISVVGHEAIRATGGRNATRVIMIPTNGQGNQSTLEAIYPTRATLPGAGHDPYLAIQVHTYDPWSFCGQDGKNDAYPGDDWVAANLRRVAAHGRALGVPINYGEFGVGRAERQADRDTAVVRGFYRTIAQTALAERMSATVWDDGGWFGLVERGPDGALRFTHGIVPAMF